jgi:hypothetical protein
MFGTLRIGNLGSWGRAEAIAGSRVRREILIVNELLEFEGRLDGSVMLVKTADGRPTIIWRVGHSLYLISRCLAHSDLHA